MFPRAGQEDIDASAPLLPTLNTSTTPQRKSRPFVTVVSLVLVGIGAIALFIYYSANEGSTMHGTPDPAWPTFIGYEGPTPTGSEPLAAETSYPKNYDSYPLHPPSTIPASTSVRLSIIYYLVVEKIVDFDDVKANWVKRSSSISFTTSAISLPGGL